MSKKIFAMFSVMDGMYFAFCAAFHGFITSYMLECGLSSSSMSLMLAVYMLCAFLGSMFWGNLCDKLHTNKKVFLFEFLAMVIIAMAIWFFVDKLMIVSVVLYPLYGFFLAPLGSNIDAWMLKVFHQDAGIYGKARSVGSIGYAMMMLLAGQLINMFGYIFIPILALSTACVVYIMAIILKEEKYVEKKQEKQSSGKLTDLARVKPYVFMMLIVFFIGLCIAPINNMKIVLLTSVGGDVGILGIDSFIGVMIQAGFIFFAAKLKRFSTNIRLFMMVLCIMTTMILVAVAQNPWMIVTGNVFNNISYGIMLPTQREITETHVPDNLKNTAHSLSDAMFGSFSGILALLYSGAMMDAFGAKSVAVLGMFVMCIPLVLTIIQFRKTGKQEQINV